ncbi:S8 family serine peptidase [Nocardiopsis deserti]|uniref:S8 family serine peptidase n=1 Tax=Nocardiopsis deserti TaxID=2605988 RepID=UPI00123A3EC5|nr:S8 family serine peptidase [Nocardiopsis deserti]
MLGGNSRNRIHTRRVRGGASAAFAAATAAVLGLTAVPAAADLVPDYRPEQWGLQAVGAPELWEENQGQGATVALPGVSVDEGHPDLVDNIQLDTRFGENDGDVEQGNATAGLVAAHGHGRDADGGVLGVAPEATVLALPTGDQLAEAVRFASQEGAQVILLPEPAGPDLAEATQEASDNGALVVGPAGEDEDPNVLTVAGTDQDGALVPGAPGAGMIALTAPGADLVTAGPEPSQAEVTGAPYAAAMVAGAAALMRAEHPQLRPDQVRDALVDGSRPGPDGLPALHLPSAEEQASGVAQDIPLIDEDLTGQGEQSGLVPAWAWFVTVGAVVVLGVLILILWVRRSTADPYGVKAERREQDELIASERAAEAAPASRRRKGGRRRRTRGN